MKGSGPLHIPALSRAPRRKPEIVSRHPTAKETLRTVLARLEDLKAEDSVVIDLTGKSSIGDYMVVTSGRSQRHVNAVADHLKEGQAVRVKVLEADEKGRLRLSMKAVAAEERAASAAS